METIRGKTAAESRRNPAYARLPMTGVLDSYKLQITLIFRPTCHQDSGLDHDAPCCDMCHRGREIKSITRRQIDDTAQMMCSVRLEDTNDKTKKQHSPSSYTSLAVWSTSVTALLLPHVAT